MTQVAIEGDRVQQVLQVIALVAHRDGQRPLRVARWAVAEVVRLPVKDEKAAFVLEDQVDEALEEALQGREGQPRHAVAATACSVSFKVSRVESGAAGQVEFEFDELARRRFRSGPRPSSPGCAVPSGSGVPSTSSSMRDSMRARRSPLPGRPAPVPAFSLGDRRRAIVAPGDAKRVEHAHGIVDPAHPGVGAVEVDLFEDLVDAFAGRRTAREVQDVVVRNVGRTAILGDTGDDIAGSRAS